MYFGDFCCQNYGQLCSMKMLALLTLAIRIIYIWVVLPKVAKASKTYDFKGQFRIKLVHWSKYNLYNTLA